MVFVIPIFYLFTASFLFGYGGITLYRISQLILAPSNAALFLNTLTFGICGSLLATSLGTIYAWVTGRTDVPGKKILETIPVLVLIIPFIVKAFAWIMLFSPQIGLFNVLLRMINSNSPVVNIFSVGGIVFALGFGGFPLTYLTIKPAVDSLNPSLEEASMISGHGILTTIRKVTLPLLLPAIGAAYILDAITGFENFDYPFLLGAPGGIRSLATEVYYWTFEHMPPDYASAAIISLVYLALTFSALGIYIYVTRRTYKFTVVSGKATQRTVHRLGKWRYVMLALCLGIFGIAFVLPFSVIVVMAFIPFTSFVGVAPLSLTLDNFREALALPLFWKSFLNAAVFAGVSALVAAFVAVFLSYGALKSKARGARLIEYVSGIPLAFPGIVYGLSLFWMFLFLPGVGPLLYGTLWPLIIAMAVIRMPHCVRMISGNLIQISNELEEASAVCGAGWWRTMGKVVIPLLRKGIVNGISYTFVNGIRELGAIILLVTPGSVVLTVLLLNLYMNHGESLPILSAASTIMVLFIAAVLIFSNVIQHLTERSKRA